MPRRAVRIFINYLQGAFLSIKLGQKPPSIRPFLMLKWSLASSLESPVFQSVRALNPS